MGQYYKLCVLNSKKKNYPNKKKVAAWLSSYDFDNGAKLMEFSWMGNNYVSAFESLICKESGEYAGYPVIVAGDYADEEPLKIDGENETIYSICKDYGKKIAPSDIVDSKHYRYLINEDKKVFIDTERMRKNKQGWRVNPLPLLCSDGNGRGGGDYFGKFENRCGLWKRNVVVTSDNRPDENEYKEVFYDFYEKL